MMTSRGIGAAAVGIGCLIVLATGGCASFDVVAPRVATTDAGFVTVEPARRENVAALIASLPMGGENIVRRQIADGPESSVFLVRIGDREEPHRHTRYDMTVVVVEGSGTLWLDGEALPMNRGDIAHVPRGVPHYFVNDATAPASAMVVFSPKFSGPDSQPTPP